MGIIRMMNFGQRGNILPIVLILMSIITITISIFLYEQSAYSTRYRKESDKVQLLATIRSGLTLYLNSSIPSAAKNVSGFSWNLGEDLFEESSLLSNSLNSSKDSIPNVVFPFSDGLQSCTISVCTSDCFIEIKSSGSSNEIKKAEKITIAGTIEDSKTVLYTSGSQNDVYDAVKILSGKILTSNSYFLARFIDSLGVSQFQSKVKNLLSFENSSVVENVLILKAEQYYKLPKTIKGNLTIDGSKSGLIINDTAARLVEGDFQTTGVVTMNSVRLIVKGESRIFDKTTFNSSFLVCGNRLFLGDELTKSSVTFDGLAIANGNIEIASDTKITNQSICIFFSNSINETSVPSKSVFIRPNSFVHGSVINLSKGYSIVTYPESKVVGILFSMGSIQHMGTLEGLAIAASLDKPAGEELPGTIKYQRKYEKFSLPYFFTHKIILRWTSLL